MAEVMFEILLFSAYLSAALISVVIAVYAVAVSYLGRETSRIIWSLKKRQRELKKRIKRFEDKMDIGEMEKEIKSYKQEESALKGHLFYLSVNGAVLLPLAALSVALLFSLGAIYNYSWLPNIGFYVVCTFAFNALGVISLLIVLKTIEWAALRVPLPKFEVFFETWLSKEKMATREKRGLRFWICNRGEIIAEDVEVFLFFPPGFKISSAKRYEVFTQSKKAIHPGYHAAIFSYENIHVNTDTFSPKIAVEAPEKPDKYKIPICIYERNIGESEHELLLEVVD